MNHIPVKEILLVVLGGLFGWSLGKMPDRWVYMVLAFGIMLLLVVVLKK